MELTQAENIKDIVQRYYQSKNQTIDPNDILTTPLFSLSNLVFRVQLPQQHDILVKVYLSALPQFTDNALETQLVTQFAHQKQYPQVLYSCPSYRIEQFIPSVAIERATFGETKLLQLAKQMAEYSCKFKGFVGDYSRAHGISSKFTIDKLQETFWKIHESKAKECPDLVLQCSPYIGKVFGAKDVMATLGSLVEGAAMVLNHNDCHLGNVLDDGNKLYILDHEFSQYNYIGFDLGNFFNEWATDYGKDFQIREDQELHQQIQKAMIQVYFQTLGQCYIFSPSFADWLKYVTLGRALSHLFWMTVGLKQINDSRIEFSMVKYIRRRQEEFTRWLARLQCQ